MIDFDQVVNFRDIGGPHTRSGAQVRTGQVYRSAHLADATERDLATLEQLNVRTIIDLRDPEDINRHGENRLPRGAQLVRIPYPGERDYGELYNMLALDAEAIRLALPPGSAYELMVANAADAACEENWCAQLADMIREVANSDGAVVVHCSAGKDRTGFAVAIIYLILGVPEDVIIADYLRSNDQRLSYNREALEHITAIGADPALFEPLVVQHEDYIRQFLNTMDARWGGINDYVRYGLGVGDRDVAALRHRLLVE